MKMNNFIGILLLVVLTGMGCRNEQPSMNEENTLMDRQIGKIKLALVQMNVVGGELDINLQHAAEQIAEAAPEGAHLALLPEVMDLGWTHPSAKTLAYPISGGKTFEHLAEAAKENQIYVVAGIVEKDGEKTYNTAVLLAPDGNEVLQAPFGADADTIIYLDVETRERPARGTDWNEYWDKGK